MALTLDSNPNLFVLSKSPMYIAMATDRYVVNPGVKAPLILSNVDLALNIAGGTFTFKWADETVIMTIVAGTPDDTGTQVPVWVLGQSNTYYNSVLVTHLKNNYLLNNLFDITSTPTYVSLTAKNFGLEFDLTNSSVINTGYAKNVFIATEEYAVQANYKMFVEVFVETSHGNGLFEKVGTQELDLVDLVDYICSFDISKMVNAKLEYALPSYNESVPQRNTSAMKRFYCRYAEKYGSPVVVKKMYETTPVEALKSGFNFVQFPSSVSAIANHYISKKLFLTRQPRIKKISAVQQEYLHWISPDTTTANVVMAVKLYKDDGTTATGATVVPSSIGAKQLYRFPAGYDQWVATIFPLVPFSLVTKYEVWLQGDWGAGYVVASEVFTYICDKDSYRDERYFLFTNSDGGVDTFRATGLKIETTEVEGDVLNIDSRSPVTGQYIETNKLIKSSVVQSTGFLTRAQNKWLNDLFAAECKWEVVDGKFIPIVITTKQKPFDESQTKPFAFDFEYFYSFDDTVIKSDQL